MVAGAGGEIYAPALSFRLSLGAGHEDGGRSGFVHALTADSRWRKIHEL
jgi:hypothetical protein